MCDENTVREDEAYLNGRNGLSRRGFGALGAAAAAGAVLPSPENALAVEGADVTVKTPDGAADAYYVRPKTGKHPAVLMWPDIRGLRPAFRDMAKRLAQSGYAVLVVNPFYRVAKSPILAEGESFEQPDVRKRLVSMMQALTPDVTGRDAQAFVAFLDGQDGVDKRPKMGVTGYCMGGPMTFRTAAAFPDRVGAACSFHGAALVTDQPSSPHLLIPKLKAQYLVAIAENDDAREPDAKTKLKAAFAEAQLPAEVEVYAGAQHGWCPPDSTVYNEAQAERAWAKQLALFRKALA